MAIFMLDCDSVTSSASSINSLVTQFSQLADSVNGYDTSCEDGFDFAGGNAAVAANIDACTTKVQNTVKLVEGVVTSHTALQNSFTIDQNGSSSSETQNKQTGTNTNTTGTNTNTTGTNTNTTGTNTNTTNTNNTGSYYTSSSGNYNSSNNSGGSYGGGSYYAGAGAAVGAGAAASTTTQTTTGPVDVTNKINAVDQVTVDVDKLDPENKTQFITGMTYNQAGYATFEDKYVIVCDTTLAKVGDNIIFTKPDGTKIDCVVGAVVDYSQEYKGNVSFIVNNTWNAQGANNLTFDLKNMTIMNNGQYVPKKV